MDLPDQTGRVAIVTGANTGIGEVTARELARAGAKVYLACRSTEKATEAMGRIRTDVPEAKLKFLKLDLASQASVREAAAEFRELEDRLDLLINNAGLAGPKGLTEEGFELTFGVNHLGHFLLTLLLVDMVVDTGNARIVNVASESHYLAKDGIDFSVLRQPTASTTGMPEYGVSKLANVLFTTELDRRLADTDVTTSSLHPGAVASDIWGRSFLGKIVGWVAPLFLLSVEDGAKTTLFCATSAEAAETSGAYWDSCKLRRPSKLVTEELAAELWQKSLEWTDAPDWPR